MKSFIIMPFVFLLGLLIGAWQPRSQIAQLNKDLETANELLKNDARKGSRRLDVTEMLGIEDVERASPKTKNAQEAADTNTPPAFADEIVAEAVPETTNDPAQAEFDLDDAIDAWLVRVDLARTAFISNAGLNSTQVMLFDQSIDDMNLVIGETIDLFAESLDGAEQVQPEAAYRIMDVVLASMVNTYDTIDQFAPADWRRSAGESFDLINFIDPEVARPLVGLDLEH